MLTTALNSNLFVRYLPTPALTFKAVSFDACHIHCSLTRSKQPKNEVKKKQIPLTIAYKRINYSGTNLTKEAEYLYSGNYKTLLKEIKEDTDKQNVIQCSWLKKTRLRWQYFPN